MVFVFTRRVTVAERFSVPSGSRVPENLACGAAGNAATVRALTCRELATPAEH
jgi:hypothetical protein